MLFNNLGNLLSNFQPGIVTFKWLKMINMLMINFYFCYVLLEVGWNVKHSIHKTFSFMNYWYYFELIHLNWIIYEGKILQSSVRWASKKAGGSSKNRKGHAPGKRRGLKAQDKENVTINSILLRQLGVRCHPGLNVSIKIKFRINDGKHWLIHLLRWLNSCYCRLVSVKMDHSTP